jgi:mRNA-degrading endonuclease RelE of RelBE toxin-antitoxin system
MAFQIRFEDEAVAHLDKFKAKERFAVLGEIEKQLVKQPDVRTRHRQQLRSNSLAKWQLSIDDFRVFYDIDDSQNEVVILAIGTKAGNRLIIGGKEYRL